MNNVQLAIEYIYPLVAKYQMEKKATVNAAPESKMHFLPTRRGKPLARRHRREVGDEQFDSSDMDSDEDFSDTSEEGY